MGGRGEGHPWIGMRVRRTVGERQVDGTVKCWGAAAAVSAAAASPTAFRREDMLVAAEGEAEEVSAGGEVLGGRTPAQSKVSCVRH